MGDEIQLSALVTKVSPVGMLFELRLLLLSDDISASKYLTYPLETWPRVRCWGSAQMHSLARVTIDARSKLVRQRTLSKFVTYLL